MDIIMAVLIGAIIGSFVGIFAVAAYSMLDEL